MCISIIPFNHLKVGDFFHFCFSEPYKPGASPIDVSCILQVVSISKDSIRVRAYNYSPITDTYICSDDIFSLYPCDAPVILIPDIYK